MLYDFLATEYREVIRDQIDEYRSTLVAPVVCSFTGLLTRSFDIDHCPPFSFLVFRFLQSQSLSLHPVQVVKALELRAEFAEFHREQAKLRPASKSANRAAGSERLNWHELIKPPYNASLYIVSNKQQEFVATRYKLMALTYNEARIEEIKDRYERVYCLPELIDQPKTRALRARVIRSNSNLAK